MFLISAAIKFMRRTIKYTWQDYKPIEDILSELKINPVVKKIPSHWNKRIQHVRCMDRDRLTHLTVWRLTTHIWVVPHR